MTYPHTHVFARLTNFTSASRKIGLVTLALALIAPQVVASAQTANPSACVTTYSDSTDYFPDKTTIEYSAGLEIEYFKHYKVVRVKQPWAGAQTAAEYVLVQCGTPAPTDPALKDATVIEIPIKTMIAMSTTYLPHLVKLGKLENLIGVDTLQFASDPDVVARGKAGKLIEIGAGAQVNLELVATAKPDLIMTYGIGSPEYDTHPKLIEAGFKVALNADYMETSPLGRAEWIKFTALFFNAERQANESFETVANAYTALTALTVTVTERPALLIGTPYQDVWYIPGGKSFAAQFIYDAGATYEWADDPSTGSLPLSIETVFAKAKDADLWLSPGYFTDRAAMLAADERFSNFAAFKNDAVWNNDLRTNANGGNDYYESGVADPQLVLADMIAIVHPALLPDHRFIYFRKLK